MGLPLTLTWRSRPFSLRRWKPEILERPAGIEIGLMQSPLLVGDRRERRLPAPLAQMRRGSETRSRDGSER